MTKDYCTDKGVLDYHRLTSDMSRLIHMRESGDTRVATNMTREELQDLISSGRADANRIRYLVQSHHLILYP